ncbi:hypothetical protein ON010_g2141 [Phytophthora cinnamomi]|nr:hypothetical protein ON010_g2141 [Phytophthora cinnamomi]
MPSSFAMRFMKAVSDRQGSDINMDEFLRAVAILRCGTMEDQLQFIFNMCDLDHAGKVQSTGLSNFLVSLHGRHVLDRPEYRRLLSEGFDQGRVRMTSDDFIKIVPELKAYHTLVDWMAPFADILCETADPQLLESQEEFNPAVQQKILANETHFNAKEVSMLQDAFNNYRASGGGDAVDLDALTSDFPLEMSEERFNRVFNSFGSRANGSDIDVFSFVSALSVACRGTTKEKAEFAFRLFASVGDNTYMTREDIYGMLRLDITQNPELESQITALIEKKHPALNATKSSSSSSLIESMGPRTPSVSGSELGIFVDGVMKGFGQRRSVWDASSSSKQTEALTLTVEEFTAWAIKQKYEMATLRIMREVAFIDLGLVPATKEEELLIATGCYNAYDPDTLVEDDRWYLIERKWYIHWCRYIKIRVKESLLLSPRSMYPVVLVRLRRTEDEIKVPLNRLRSRQARLLYIPLLSRKLSYSAVYFKNPFRPVPFGSPNLVRLCPELTSGLQLYQLIWERVKQYVGPNAKSPTEWAEDEARNIDCLVANHIDGVFAGLNDASATFSSKCGFLLRRVESKGLTDSRSSWLTRSFGFTIPCTSEPLDILEEEAIAIDWDLSIFQDRETMDKMKHVENHDSVARNEAIDKGPVPLRHCLDAFTSEEKISEGYCSSCRQHQEMTKKLEIWRLPPVMVVHLKRFQYTQTYRRKLGSLVEFPIHDLDLSCCVAPHIEIPDKYPMKRPKSTSSGVSAPARKLIKLRSRGGSTASNGTVPTSQTTAVDSSVDEGATDADKQDEHPADGDSEEDTQGEKPEDSEMPAETTDVSAEGDAESPSPDTKAGSNATTDTETTSTSTTDSQRAAAAQAAAVRNRVRRGYTNSNLDQSRCLETKYNLYGVVNHQGALGGGHYTAYAKNFVDDQWYYYDDERVRVVEEQQVVSPSAYLLFYLRSDMDSVLVKDLFPKNMKPGKITDEDIERFVEEGDERRCTIM